MDGSTDDDAPAAPPGWSAAELWDRLRGHADAGARASLIEAFRPYAKMVAATFYGRRFDDEIQFDDYHQWALVGMIESIDRFDPAQGIKFETFASRRMRGAILDGIECATEKQRQIGAQRRLRASRLGDVKTSALEGTPKAGGAVPVDDRDLLGYLAEVGMGLALGMMLEGTTMIEAPCEIAATVETGYERAELRQLRRSLHGCVGQLSPQEQGVIRSHYLDDRAFDDIAAELHLSKGRISQIHRQALGKLRQLLGAQRLSDVLV